LYVRSKKISSARQLRDQNAAKIVAALRAGARLDPDVLADIIELYALDLQERDDTIDKIRNRLASLGIPGHTGDRLPETGCGPLNHVGAPVRLRARSSAVLQQPA
jgi:hypothetical protein